MSRYVVDDNAVSKEVMYAVDKQLTNTYFPWYLNINGSSDYEDTRHFAKIIPNVEEHERFVHVFMRNGEIVSDHLGVIPMLFEQAITKHFREGEIELIRCKANLNCSTAFDAIQTPHIDRDDDHYVMIYYVNDSDGDTTIYNEEWDGSIAKPLSLTVKDVVSYKKGRCVIFKGSHYHSGSFPKLHDSRIVINFNFRVK